MGVQVKEVKKSMIKIGIPALSQIKTMLNSFRIETRGDMHRLNDIDRVCETAEKARIGVIEKFKTDNNIPADVEIGEHHTGYRELYEKIFTEEIEINPNALALFTQKELDYATGGGNFTYGGIKLLEKYLVKKED